MEKSTVKLIFSRAYGVSSPIRGMTAAPTPRESAERTIQVNRCKIPDYSNFGVPARTRHGKTEPSAERDKHNKVPSTKRAARCP